MWGYDSLFWSVWRYGTVPFFGPCGIMMPFSVLVEAWLASLVRGGTIASLVRVEVWYSTLFGPCGGTIASLVRVEVWYYTFFGPFGVWYSLFGPCGGMVAFLVRVEVWLPFWSVFRSIVCKYRAGETSSFFSSFYPSVFFFLRFYFVFSSFFLQVFTFFFLVLFLFLL